MTLQSFEDGNSDEARQFLLDRRCERNHPKRHRTQKRAKRLSAKRRAQIKAKNERAKVAARKYHEQVRAYWSGEVESHP